MKKSAAFCFVVIMMVCILFGGCKKEARDISGDTPLASSVVYANSMANKVQGYYNGAARTRYTLENTEVKLTNDLNDTRLTSLSDLKDNIYFKDTMDAFLEDTDGNRYYASDTSRGGRVNTLRLGYYYYESHVYDMTFGESKVINKTTKYVDAAEFDKENFTVSAGPHVRYENSLIAEYEEGYSSEIEISKSDISISVADYQGLLIRMGGGAENCRLLVYIDGKPGKEMIDFTPGTPIDLASAGYTSGQLTGYKIYFTPTGTYAELTGVSAMTLSPQPRAVSLDKGVHIYSDKLHQEIRIVTQEPMGKMKSMGVEFTFDKAAVKKYEKSDGYVAFDIKKAGVVGFILPSDGSVSLDGITENDETYTVSFSMPMPSEVAAGYIQSFGLRIYTDSTHSFDGIKKTSLQERNPITDISIDGENIDNAVYLEYDFVRGMYRFDMDGTGFNEAYYQQPDKYYRAAVSLLNNSYDRNAYIWFNTGNGCLEGAAIADEDETLIPIPLQVGKNFCGEMEEPIYLPGDPAYGDTIFPLTLKAEEKLSFHLFNLYQNWGSTPLKQLSWIQFVCSYYHLSTGVTESNCIAPYFYNGTNMVLPDFRGRSGIMWEGQPQFNSVGNPSFVTDETYTGSNISSSGPSYADISYSYYQESEGLYQYTLRHVEFPQTDENRTYYTITIEFLKSGTIDNNNSQFSFAVFESTDTSFSKIEYLDENNHPVTLNTLDVYNDGGTVNSKLGDQGGYISIYGINGSSTWSRGANVAYIVKNISGKLGGKPYTGGVKMNCTVYDSDGQCGFRVSPDVDVLHVKKGDKLVLDVILLPWGSQEDTDNAGALKVRNDSVLHPISVEAVIGTVIEDTWLPRIRCADNEAEFTLSGSDNNNVVRIDGFTKLCKPLIEKKDEADGSWHEYVTGNNPYDGYSVFYDSDTGNYSYAFVYSESGTYRVSA